MRRGGPCPKRVIARRYRVPPNGTFGFVDGTGGPGGTTQFGFRREVAVDTAGNVYVADTSNHRIRKITGLR